MKKIIFSILILFFIGSILPQNLNKLKSKFVKGKNTSISNPGDSVVIPPVTPVVVPIPSNFIVEGGSNYILLSWVSEVEVDSIQIYRGVSSGSLSLYLTIPDTLSYRDNVSGFDSSLFYKIRSKSSSNVSEFTSTQSGTTDSYPLIAPSSFAATGGDSLITISFTIPQYSDSTEIEYSTDSLSFSHLVNTVSDEFIHQDLSPGIKLYYRGRTFLNDLLSSYTDIVSATTIIIPPDTTINWHEMIANNTFDVNTTGWSPIVTVANSATLSYNSSTPISGAGSGNLVTNGDETQTDRPRLTATLSRAPSVDSIYTVTITVRNNGASSVLLRYIYLGGSTAKNKSFLANSTETYTFTKQPTGTLTTLYFGFDGTEPWNIDVDDIHVGIPDTTITGGVLPPPAVPLNFTAVADTFSIEYTWTNAESYDSIHVYTGTTSSVTLDTTIVGSSTSWVYNNLPHNTSRYVKLIAEVDERQSLPTSTLRTTTMDSTTATEPEYYRTPSVTDTEFFVASWGTDNATGLDSANALSIEGLNNKWSSIGAGDAVNFFYGDTLRPVFEGARIGVIRIPNGKQGDASNYIQFRAYGDTTLPKPYISDDNCTGYFQLLRSGAMKYFAFVNLEIDGEIYFRANEDTEIGLDHIKFLNCVIRNKSVNLYSAFSSSMSQFPAENLSWAKIQNITFYKNKFYNTTGNGGCINVSAWGNFYVGYNEFYNVQEEALDLAGGGYHVVEYNLVSGASVNGMKFHSQFRRFHNSIIRGNVILHAATTATGMVFQNIDSCSIYNNTIYSSYGAFFGNRDRLPYESYYGSFRDNLIANNIICGTTQIQGSWKDSETPYSPQGWYNCIDSIYYYNIFTNNTLWDYTNESTALRFWINDGYPDDTEAVNDSKTVSTGNQTSFTTNWGSKTTNSSMRSPQFEDPSWTSSTVYGNFTPAEASDEVGSGTAISGWIRTFSGSSVVNPPNRGAY